MVIKFFHASLAKRARQGMEVNIQKIYNSLKKQENIHHEVHEGHEVKKTFLATALNLYARMIFMVKKS